MSYTSASGAWIEGPSLPSLLGADDPVDTYTASVLINNLNHLRDTGTQERISIINPAPLFDDTTDGEAAIVAQASTPWTIMSPGKLARPVLRVGAKRTTAGTSYLSAGLWPMGQDPHAYGDGALAFWDEVTMTNTSHAIVIEAAADIAWTKPDGLTAISGDNPLATGGVAGSSVDVMMVTLTIFSRHTATARVDVSLVQLREFSGP